MSDKKGETNSNFVKWFSELSNKDISIAGGKGASLAEMYNSKFPIPPGFMVTAQAYEYFIDQSGLKSQIKEILEELDVENTSELDTSSQRIRALIENADMPKPMKDEIWESYDILDLDKNSLENASHKALQILKNSHEPPFVAVRSSATAEDLIDASFAGQQDSFLNVKGKSDLIESIKKCWASLFNARAIYYRTKKDFDHLSTYLAVVVQKMINSDKSGVMFSQNPVGAKNEIIIEGVWGLGEGIVSGKIKPDTYIIDSNLSNFKIINQTIGEKKIAITRDASGNNTTIPLIGARSKQQVLSSDELKKLATYAKKLEEHYQKPQDIEFAILDSDIFIVQSRPITTLKNKQEKVEIEGKTILSGLGASPGVSSGPVKIVRSMEDLPKVRKGDVLVTEMTNPDMVVSMQKAAGIITDEGGITSHAAIVSREMGIPAVVGTGEATKLLKDGQIVSVDGTNGKVYDGKVQTRLEEVKPIVPTKTKIRVIVDLPEVAPRAARSESKYVGLVRLEGIIASSGKHPLYFVKKKKMDEYTLVIYEGLKTISQPFEEIWVRTSDIRSDEYKNIEGAPQIDEDNPMLGNHGIRFSLKNPDILIAEMEAIKRLSIEFPEKKFGLMIPQVISVSELQETKKYASQLNLTENVKIGIMVETPAAVQIINDLCEEGIDFISFGTNDLTQYILAIDRNNESIQNLYDEMNPAVLSAISYVIRRCKKNNIQTSICGQAASKEEMVRFLMKEGIDSVTVNADAAEKISKIIAKIENPDASFDSDEKKAKEDDYSPGEIDNPKEEIPSLNDSISVDNLQEN